MVENVWTFLLGDLLNLLSDGYLQCSNDAMVTQVYFVPENPSEEEIC